MLRRLRLWVSLLVFLCTSVNAAERSAEMTITPMPASLEVLGGSFTVERDTQLVIAADAAVESIARYFGDLLFRMQGLRPEIVQASAVGMPKKVLQFTLGDAVPGAEPESYRLEISSKGIVVEAAEPRGLFYGATTLWQILTADVTQTQSIRVPALRIVDAPRLRWRGLLLDSASHYQSVEFIKRFIDLMALHKLNVLQWQLADDQAWRLEISKYPGLTAAPTKGQGRSADPGFYSQNDVREIVQHAAARHVAIVPGLGLPGNAAAAIAAYPDLGASSSSNLYNIDEATFGFIDNVFSEVAALFPGEYIYIGAEDTPKDQWASSPRVQARMRELGIANERNLRRYFMERVSAMLNQRGRRIVGWDGVLSGGVAPGAVVTTSKGLDGALAAAGAGYEVVVSSSMVLNLDHPQVPRPDERLDAVNVVSLEDIYEFDPAPLALSAMDRSRLIGMQANVWTRMIDTEEQVESMTFPRAAAVAEVAWTPAGNLRWSDFQQRLVPLTARYARLGVRYSDDAFRVFAIQRGATGDRVSLELVKQMPLGEIRYTLNGSAPTPRSTAYMDVLEVTFPVTLRAAPFYNGAPLARPTTVQLDQNSLTQSSR